MRDPTPRILILSAAAQLRLALRAETSLDDSAWNELLYQTSEEVFATLRYAQTMTHPWNPTWRRRVEAAAQSLLDVDQVAYRRKHHKYLCNDALTALEDACHTLEAK
jgi:hypothetical protein